MINYRTLFFNHEKSVFPSNFYLFLRREKEKCSKKKQQKLKFASSLLEFFFPFCWCSKSLLRFSWIDTPPQKLLTLVLAGKKATNNSHRAVLCAISNHSLVLSHTHTNAAEKLHIFEDKSNVRRTFRLKRCLKPNVKEFYINDDYHAEKNGISRVNSSKKEDRKGTRKNEGCEKSSRVSESSDKPQFYTFPGVYILFLLFKQP